MVKIKIPTQNKCKRIRVSYTLKFWGKTVLAQKTSKSHDCMGSQEAGPLTELYGCSVPYTCTLHP